MKTIIKLIIVIFFCSQLNSQDMNSVSTGIHRGPDLTYNNLLFIKLNELLSYKEGFKYYNEILNQKFEKVETETTIDLLIGSNVSTKTKFGNNEPSHIMRFIKQQVEENGVTFNFLRLENESECIDYDLALKKINENSLLDNYGVSPFSQVSYVSANAILADRQICNFDPSHNYGKILNKTVSTQHIVTGNNQPCHLFGDVTDGAVITYSINGTVYTKIVSTDNIWDRVTWYDQTLTGSQIAQSIGSSGSGNLQFRGPSGISVTGPYASGNQNIYYIYTADRLNGRIVLLNYYVTPTCWIGCQDFIDPNSFFTVKWLSNPYDIEVHQGSNASISSDDVLWITQEFGSYKQLYSCWACCGGDINTVRTFVYRNQSFALNPSRISVYRSPDGGTNLLACTDNTLRAVVFFKLNTNGSFYSNTPTATSVWQFPPQANLTSVKLYSVNPSFGVDAIVSYNDAQNNGYINAFKVNTLNGNPYADYIASYNMGSGSPNSFYKLNNLGNQNGFDELYTLEHWDNNYGIRRYKTGLNLVYENASTRYCKDAGMDLTYRITNPARIDFNIQYSPDGGTTWQAVNSIISGLVWGQNGTAWIPSGTNNLHIALDLPSENLGADVPFPLVKIFVRMVPQDETPGTPPAPYQINKTYNNLPVVEHCNIGGGCPYIYIDNGQGLQQDNNILHRSEFLEYQNSDIVDHYKLNVAPVFDPSHGLGTIQLKELNSDIDYFDEIKLETVDHPLGTVLAITENQDMILYFPQFVINPDTAFLNYDSIITCSLAYDSNCTSIGGDSGNAITSSSSIGLNKSNVGFQILKTIQQTSKYVLSLLNEKYNNKKFSRDEDLVDSMAIIFDPQRDIGTPSPKTNAGILKAFDRSNGYSSGSKVFARRENRSIVAVPVSSNFYNIDSVYTKWLRDYNISFLCTSPVYYGGYLENELELVSAQHSLVGDVTALLSSLDQDYSTIDSTATLNIQFMKTSEPIPDGWTRDYVLIVYGKYSHQGDNMTLVKRTGNNVPSVFALHQNYPNPFNPSAVIKYDLPKDVKVTIKIYDILGREVKILVNEFKQAGYYEAVFNGSSVASGVYFYRIEAGSFIESKKMVLVK